MTDPTPEAEPPVLALSIEQAATSLGISVNTFRRHVLPHVRTIAVGKVRIVPVVELERWMYLYADFDDDE